MWQPRNLMMLKYWRLLHGHTNTSDGHNHWKLHITEWVGNIAPEWEVFQNSVSHHPKISIFASSPLISSFYHIVAWALFSPLWSYPQEVYFVLLFDWLWFNIICMHNFCDKAQFRYSLKMQKLSVNIVSSGLSISRILAAAVGSASYAA